MAWVVANEPAISTMEQNFSRLGIEDGSFILDDTRRSMDYVPQMRASLSPAGDLVGKVAQYSRLYSVKLSKTQSIWWDGFQCLSPARHRRNNESSNEKCWDAGERSNLSDNRIRGRREKRNGKKRDIWSMEGSSPTILIARLIDRRRGLAVYLVYW